MFILHVSLRTPQILRLTRFGMNHFKIMMRCLVEPAAEARGISPVLELRMVGTYYTWWLIISIHDSWD